MKFNFIAIPLLAVLAACQSVPSGRTSDSEEAKGVVTAFVKAVNAGDRDVVAQLSLPGSGVPRQGEDLASVTGSASPDRVWLDSDRALVVSNAVQVENPRGRQDGFLVFTLVRDETSAWRVSDIDFEDDAGVDKEIASFQSSAKGS